MEEHSPCRLPGNLNSQLDTIHGANRTVRAVDGGVIDGRRDGLMAVRSAAVTRTRTDGYTSTRSPGCSVREVSLRDALQRDDRQMLAAGEVADVQIEPGSAATLDLRLRGTETPSAPR